MDNKGTKFLLIIFIILLIIGNVFWFQQYKIETSSNLLDYQQPPPSSALTVAPVDFADMVEHVSTAVVNIETSIFTKQPRGLIFNDPFFQEFFGGNTRPQENIRNGIGTGFIISSDGHVVTNQHVIDGADEIFVTISGHSNKLSAEVVGQDYELDLAVLKINSKEKFTPIKLGDSDEIRVGEWAVAIGNPYGLDHTVTAGVISAKGRPIQIDDRIYKNLIQTNAAINPGNSGGPLLNTKGEVIGINTAVNAQAQGIGFAISINTAKEVLNDLIEKGKVIRPYMGVWLQQVDNNIASYFNIDKYGVLVTNVIENSPASKAGLKKYDVIIGINEEKIDDYDKLQEILITKKVGDTIMLEILREGNPMLIPLTLAEKP